MKIKRIGVDLAKNVYQLHGVDGQDQCVLQRRLMRDNWLKVLFTEAGMRDRDGGMYGVASLGGITASPWLRGEADSPPVCEAVCQEQQERRSGC